MKLKLISGLLACLMLTNCVHVSSSGLTALGTDLENVNYVANPQNTSKAGKDGPSTKTGGHVAFSASKINNSKALGKVANTIMTSVGVWGAVKAVEGAVTSHANEVAGATSQAQIASDKAQGLAKIAAEKDLGLAKLATEAAH
jgi:hypothetical protein